MTVERLDEPLTTPGASRPTPLVPARGRSRVVASSTAVQSEPVVRSAAASVTRETLASALVTISALPRDMMLGQTRQFDDVILTSPAHSPGNNDSDHRESSSRRCAR